MLELKLMDISGSSTNLDVVTDVYRYSVSDMYQHDPYLTVNGSNEYCIEYENSVNGRLYRDTDFERINKYLKEKNGIIILRDINNSEFKKDKLLAVGYNLSESSMFVKMKDESFRTLKYKETTEGAAMLMEDAERLDSYIKKGKDEMGGADAIDRYWAAKGSYGTSGAVGTCGTCSPGSYENSNKKGSKIMDSIKTYFRKHEETIITIILIILVDQFIFKGAFSEKLKAIIDGLISKVSKKVSE